MGKPVYQLDELGYFVGVTTADESPKQPGVYHVPGGCVVQKPPVAKPGTRRRFAAGKWAYEALPGYGASAPQSGEPSIAELRAAKIADVNAWRAVAETVFEYKGATFACDATSRRRLDAVANCIALTGAFPAEYAGTWTATDNAPVPVGTVDEFRAFYAAMSAAGTAAFNRATALKAEVMAAESPEAVAAIAWRAPPAALPG